MVLVGNRFDVGAISHLNSHIMNDDVRGITSSYKGFYKYISEIECFFKDSVNRG